MAISDKEVAYGFVQYMINKAFGGKEGVDTAKDYFLETSPNSRWTDSRDKRVGEQIEKCLERVMRPVDKYLDTRK
jgi:hypothetical protein